MEPPIEALHKWVPSRTVDVPAEPETEAYFEQNVPGWSTLPPEIRNLNRWGQEDPDPADPTSTKRL